MSQKCGACDKTVYEKEKIEASNNWWHKGCFKCPEKGCGTLLTLKTFQAHEGQIFCSKHVPVPKATSVTDSVSSVAARNAPKKSAEGLHKTDVSNAEFHGLPIDAVSSQTALNAPKKSAEGLHKTDVSNAEFHGLPIDAVSSQTALKAPKKMNAESLGFNKAAGAVLTNAEAPCPAPEAY